jgi:hypothetical protein
VIVISEIAATLLIIKKPKIGANLAIIAGVLNVFQIITDPLHLMHPEIAPFAHTFFGIFSRYFRIGAYLFFRKSKNSF